MKSKRILLALLFGLIMFFAGMNIGKGKEELTEEPVTETVVDTIAYFEPIAQTTTKLKTQRYALPKYVFISTGLPQQCEADSNEHDSTLIEVIECGNDSAIVDLPIVQRHYADSTFEAWVSGPIDPRLDSVIVFTPTTIITKREWKPPKRWHVGVTAGYGYGEKGFLPYVGIGITYSIFSF